MPVMEEVHELSQAERVCRICGDCKPLIEFRFYNKQRGLRRTECNQCRSDYMAARRRARRQRGIHSYAQQVCASKRHAGRIVAVTTEMLRRFGGLERFAADWKEAVDAAMAAGKLHLVVRSVCALVDLIHVAEQLQRQEIREMSDVDLQRAMLHQTIAAVKQRPELVLHAAAELGWTVTPPEGGEDSTW